MRANRGWARAFAGVMVVWFGLVMAAPALLHSCPQAMSNSTMAEAMSGGGHAGHGAEHSGHPVPGAPVNCQCLGSCAVSTAALLPGPTTIPMANVTPIPARELSAATDVVAALQPDHSQPFATAPPLRIG
jgi:hypothetical protein